jgi:cyclopropane-fatty-acyl-phospholipid synthase
MWEFYLFISEFSFSHGSHMVFQVQLSKNVHTLPLDRSYIAQAEKELAGKLSILSGR